MTPGEPIALVLTALPVEMAAVLARLSAGRSSALVGTLRDGCPAADPGQSFQPKGAPFEPLDSSGVSSA